MPTETFEQAAGKDEPPKKRSYAELDFIELFDNPNEAGIRVISTKNIGVMARIGDQYPDEDMEKWLKKFERIGLPLVSALSALTSQEEDREKAFHRFLNPIRFEIVADSSAPEGYVLQEKGNLEKRRVPMTDGFERPLTLVELQERWSITNKINPTIKWEGQGTGGSFPLSEVVAIRLFEKDEDKPIEGSPGDTVFIYPDYHKNGTLVGEGDTYDFGFGRGEYVRLKDAKKIFEDAGINLIQMIDQNGNEIFINEAFKHTVRAQLANTGISADLG